MCWMHRACRGMLHVTAFGTSCRLTEGPNALQLVHNDMQTRCSHLCLSMADQHGLSLCVLTQVQAAEGSQVPAALAGGACKTTMVAHTASLGAGGRQGRQHGLRLPWTLQSVSYLSAAEQPCSPGRSAGSKWPAGTCGAVGRGRTRVCASSAPIEGWHRHRHHQQQ